MVYTISVGISGYFRYNRFQQEFRAKSQRFETLKVRYVKVNQMMNQLKTNTSWEKLSREKLKMIKEDEVSYRFYYEESSNGK
ncbi:MAG: FtsB family cell division protein [Candidatus Marinamargulisbacteria bacterium]